jgi:peptide/nickel transport system substrate-binding protein
MPLYLPRSITIALIGLFWLISTAWGEPRHGIAMHGEPQLPADFSHFPYANPDAPKGGSLRLAVTGGFDNLNPFNIKGERVGAMRDFVFESLMARNRGEPFALYGLVAESLDVTPDRRQVVFRLRPQARFSDGKPITARDVVYSLKTLRDYGRPHHRTYYSKVSEIIVHDEHTLELHFGEADRELVLIIGLMPILPEHFFAGRDFEATTLDPLVGSGPYVVNEVKPGERLVLVRDANYWGRDLAVSRGLWNFETIVLDYYRDNQTAFEALKKNLADVRKEPDPVRWATGYDFPAAADGGFVKDVVPDAQPAPVAGFVFNTRRAIFADIRVRQALLHAFDFEWANENLFHGLFERTQGYFAGSELSAIGRPASAGEFALLERIGAELPSDIIDGAYRIPISDGSGRDRNNLRHSLKLLHEVGWRHKDARLVHGQTGKPFTFTFFATTREQERIALHYQRSLRQIGVTMEIRQIDSSQYQQRLQTFDFDMLQFTWFNSLSPGNEQAVYWGSAAANQPGSRNYMGAQSPQIDAAIAALLAAEDKPAFIDAVRVLDRLLIAGVYMVPLYHPPGQWIGRWAYIRLPKAPSLYGFQAATAWYQK